MVSTHSMFEHLGGFLKHKYMLELIKMKHTFLVPSHLTRFNLNIFNSNILDSTQGCSTQRLSTQGYSTQLKDNTTIKDEIYGKLLKH